MILFFIYFKREIIKILNIIIEKKYLKKFSKENSAPTKKTRSRSKKSITKYKKLNPIIINNNLVINNIKNSYLLNKKTIDINEDLNKENFNKFSDKEKNSIFSKSMINYDLNNENQRISEENIKKKSIQVYNFNEEEINSLSYEEAIKYSRVHYIHVIRDELKQYLLYNPELYNSPLGLHGKVYDDLVFSCGRAIGDMFPIDVALDAYDGDFLNQIILNGGNMFLGKNEVSMSNRYGALLSISLRASKTDLKAFKILKGFSTEYYLMFCEKYPSFLADEFLSSIKLNDIENYHSLIKQFPQKSLTLLNDLVVNGEIIDVTPNTEDLFEKRYAIRL